MKHMNMKDLPKEEQPYERCLKEGPEHLTDAQLLSVVIRTGSNRASSLELARQILSLNGPQEGLLGLLHLTLPQLTAIHGIGEVKAIQLLCIGELSRRIWKGRVTGNTRRFVEARDVADYYREDMRHLEQEMFRAMLFNSKQVMIGDVLLSKGTVNAALASPREIFIEALRYQAVSLILVHNHPSGDPSPSQEDIILTRRVREAGNLIVIGLLDQIVLGDASYVSMKERGFC
ncbi:MAG: DNA repair protein RadC [Clostridiales bacterium]|nr:DNA repair protein RadC [Clostridiales bacterium]